MQIPHHDLWRFESHKKEFILPKFNSNQIANVFDKIELIEFPVSIPDFDILKISFREEVKAKKLIDYVVNKVKFVESYVDSGHPPFHRAVLHLTIGKMVEEFGFSSIGVERMAKLGVLADPRSV